MPNPNGPYPGRQLFIGLTAQGAPALIYLVTGRSPASRERRAVTRDNGVIMGPIGNAPYDALRHYTAVKYDDASGVATVTNGIQTEAIYETYRLLHNVDSAPTAAYIQMTMEGAKSEPDSLNTPRIGAVITQAGGKPVLIAAIKRVDVPAETFVMEPKPGAFAGVSTYQGDMEKPAAFDTVKGTVTLQAKETTPQALAQYLYDLSAATYNGDDIRVCAVGGVYVDGKWTLAVVNRFGG